MGELPAMDDFVDKTVVEYKTKPGSRVVIHYLIERGRYTESEYRQEEMKDMYGGVYAKAFVLFSGKSSNIILQKSMKGRKNLRKAHPLAGEMCFMGKEQPV